MEKHPSRVPRSFNEERVVFSTNGSGTTGYLCAKCEVGPSLHTYEKLTQSGSITYVEEWKLLNSCKKV